MRAVVAIEKRDRSPSFGDTYRKSFSDITPELFRIGRKGSGMKSMQFHPTHGESWRTSRNGSIIVSLKCIGSKVHELYKQQTARAKSEVKMQSP